MVDTVTAEERSRMMSAVRGKNTQPEIYVRHALHMSGFRFRLHRPDLPGKPDLALPKYRTAVFVHGCFWHGHRCRRGKRPETRREFWDKKIDGNVERDRRTRTALRASGWRPVIIWACSIRRQTEKLIFDLKGERLRKRRNSRGTRHKKRRA